jgi:hypothetical protein
MTARGSDFFATVMGVVLGLVFLGLVVGSQSVTTTFRNTPITRVLWMHAVTPTSSGTQRWYNVTLTVNGTVLASEILPYVKTPTGVPTFPSTLNISVVHSGRPIAEYNFTELKWTTGGPVALVLQITNQDLTGYALEVIAQGAYSGACTVLLP